MPVTAVSFNDYQKSVFAKGVNTYTYTGGFSKLGEPIKVTKVATEQEYPTKPEEIVRATCSHNKEPLFCTECVR